jgi:hypothetical protein
MTLGLPGMLFSILKKYFPLKEFSITGIYCHQKPIVDIKAAKDPELGDILFVYIYNDTPGTRRYNSLLMQAKKSKYSTTMVSKADEHQLKLYTDWPLFYYKRAGSLDGTTRDIMPKSFHAGAQYLLIYEGHYFILPGSPISFPMGCATPMKKLSINKRLDKELVDFITFKSGRIFEENTATTKDEWTRMIWELLAITKKKGSKRKNAGLKAFPRQVTANLDGFFSFASSIEDTYFRDLHLSSQDSSDDRNFDDNFNDQENYSPSVIVIECIDGETKDANNEG